MESYKFGKRSPAPLPDPLQSSNGSPARPDTLSNSNGMFRPDREQCPGAKWHNNNILPRMNPIIDSREPFLGQEGEDDN